VVVEVVVAVSVDVGAVADELVMSTEVGEREHVGTLTAFEGEFEIAQVKSTVPVKVLAGVTVIVEVLLVVPPGVTLMLVLLDSANVVLAEGAFQKPLQPAKPDTNVATSNNRFHCPTFIATPSSLVSLIRLCF
jgi:hypothetical protein